MKEITIVINLSEQPSEELQSLVGTPKVPACVSKVLFYEEDALVGFEPDGSVFARFQSSEEESIFKITFTALTSFQHFGLSCDQNSDEADYFANDAGILEFRLKVSAFETVVLRSVQ